MNVDYEHCGKTVLIEQPKGSNSDDDSNDDEEAVVDTDPAHVIWIEGESDFDRQDPVRDLRSVTKGILSEGMLLDDLVKAANSMTGSDENNEDGEEDREGGGGVSVFSKVGAVASRLKKVDLGDLTSLVGIDKTYSTRELELAQSFLKGESLANHMEDSYYMAMGRAVGFNTTVGEEIVRV